MFRIRAKHLQVLQRVVLVVAVLVVNHLVRLEVSAQMRLHHQPML